MMDSISKYLGSIITLVLTFASGFIAWGRISSKIEANEKKVEKLEVIIFEKPGQLSFPTRRDCSADRTACQGRIHDQLIEIKSDLKVILKEMRQK